MRWTNPYEYELLQQLTEPERLQLNAALRADDERERQRRRT